MVFAATRHVLWALNTPKTYFRPSLGCKHIFGVFRVHGTCLVAANIVPSAKEASSTPPNPVDGFEVPLCSLGKERGKGRKERAARRLYWS